MPSRLSIYPYQMGSASAKALADCLDIFRIRQVGNYRWRPHKRVINWGNSHIANWMIPDAVRTMWNKPAAVRSASDKSLTFQLLSGRVSLPDCTNSMTLAQQWLAQPRKWPDLKHAVLCRTLTRANSGRGIVLATTPAEVVPAPLYTRYVPKQHEYRIHVFKELGVVDMQQKRRASDVPDEVRNPYIRNHDAGWVFCRENVNPPPEVLNTAVNAVLCLGLDFGAVDIGYHSDIGPCVYEVNTAPGLEGQTLVNYAEAFKRINV